MNLLFTAIKYFFSVIALMFWADVLWLNHIHQLSILPSLAWLHTISVFFWFVCAFLWIFHLCYHVIIGEPCNSTQAITEAVCSFTNRDVDTSKCVERMLIVKSIILKLLVAAGLIVWGTILWFDTPRQLSVVSIFYGMAIQLWICCSIGFYLKLRGKLCFISTVNDE